MRYNADHAPAPEEWLELDEQDRIDQVIDYHKRAKKPVGENNKLHAAAHVIVENQAAMGDATVVPATLDRLSALARAAGSFDRLRHEGACRRPAGDHRRRLPDRALRRKCDNRSRADVPNRLRDHRTTRQGPMIGRCVARQGDGWRLLFRQE